LQQHRPATLALGQAESRRMETFPKRIVVV